MKKISCLFFSILFITSLNYGQSNLPGEESGQVVFVSSSTPGSITVKSTGFAKKKNESIINAATGAIYTLLFRGIAGSAYDLPMIPNESEKKNDPIVIALLKDGYTAFITENFLLTEEDKKRKTDGMKGKQTVNRITINCAALRRYLEQNNVIRKFGI